MGKVWITKCADYSDAEVHRAVGELVESFPALRDVAPGTKVVIKANLVTAVPPDRAATTHPSLLAELTRRLTEKGAVVTVGDSPGGVFSRAYLDCVYAAAGMGAVEKAGGRLNRNLSVSEGVLPGTRADGRFEYTSYLDEADLLVNFCKLKAHGMMGMSAAVKNMFGAVPGLRKPEYHYRFPERADFAAMLIDLASYFHPAISVVDAVVGMEGNGPTMGTPRKIGALLAAEDPYGLDIACAYLLGIGREQVPTVAESCRRGLVPESVWELDGADGIDEYAVRDFKAAGAFRPLTFGRQWKGLPGRAAAGFVSTVLAVRPALERKKCRGCGKCANLCPARAIVIRGGKAVIDRNVCIRCFCCQEFCPFGAMHPSEGVLVKVMNLFDRVKGRNG